MSAQVIVHRLEPQDSAQLVTDFARTIHRADGTPAFSEQTLVEVHKAAQGESQVMLLAVELEHRSSEQEMLGLAVVAGNTVELAILPTFRGQGIGSRLCQALAHELGEAVQHLSVWAHKALTDHEGIISARALHLAQFHGFAPVRDLRKMVLPLTDQRRVEITRQSHANPLPDTLELTTFIPGKDDADWVAVNSAAFAEHPEQGSLGLSDLAQRTTSDWFRAEGFFLARQKDTGQIAGFHWTKIPADQEPDQSLEGEVYAVGIAPSWQGKGLGRALTLAGMDYLGQTTYLPGRSLDTIALYVDASNTAALRLYESLGFVVETQDTMFEYAGTDQ